MTREEAREYLINISYQIGTIGIEYLTCRDGDKMRQAIEVLALEEPHWIPCSKRLPEQYGNYLISIDGKDPDIGTINPNDPRGWSLCDANGFYWANDKALNITAWQTLPEPYREEGDQDGRDQ